MQRHEGVEHLGCAGDDVPALRVRLAGQRADAAAGFEDQQRARGGVPRRQADLPEPVEAARRDISEVERGGARAADAGRRQHHGLAACAMYSSIQRALARYGKPVPISAPSSVDLLADADALAVELRAVAARGGEQLLAHRVVDDGVLEPAAMLDGDRDGEHRKAVQEIGGAVERIDDPHELVAAAAAGLLAQEAMVGMHAPHRLDDVPLGHVVDFGDEIVPALGLHVEAGHAVEVADDDVAGAACGADGDVEHWLHDRAASRSRRVDWQRAAG